MNLKEKDIELKQLNIENAEELFKLTDKNRLYLRQWLPWVDDTKTIDDTKAFIQSVLENKNAIQFGILHKGILVGVIGYHFINKTNRIGHIGYWLDESHQGEGIMTTACRLIINYGFNDLNLNRIEISCALENKKSNAIPKKLGFRKEGRFRDVEWLYDHFVDHDFYALLRKEWKEE